MPRIRELQEKLGGLQKQMRSVLDKASSEKRELNAEEAAKYDAIETEFDNVNATIEREKRAQNIERELDAPTTQGVRASGTSEKSADEKAAYREAFFQALIRGTNSLSSEQTRVLQKGVVADGGYLVPTEFQTTVISALNDLVLMRQLGTVIRTSSITKIPLAGAKPTFAYIAENGVFGETDAKFGQVSLDAFQAGGIIKASNVLLKDAFIDVEQYIRGLVVSGLEALEENKFILGTGVGMPTGVVVGSSLGTTTASASAVTADEIIDLYYSIRAPYRDKATFMFSDTAMKAIRKLKGTDGQYIWGMGLGQAPDTILGRPVKSSSVMAGLGTGNKFGIFGDMSYYQVADRGEMNIQRLNELYAATDQVGFKCDNRNDGILTLSESVVHIKNA